MQTRWIVHVMALSVATAGIGALRPARAAESPEQRQAAADVRGRIHDATALARAMRRDHRLARILRRSKGVLLVPHYGRGGIVLGGVGGSAMLLVHRGGDWYGPVFYSIGGINIGPQFGATGGRLALLLMNNATVAKLEKNPSRWSLDAAAGLKVVKFGGEAENSGSYGDVVLWSQLSGLYGGVSLGARDIRLDADANHTYYHRNLHPRQIVAGTVRLSHSQALHLALGAPAEKAPEIPRGP